MDARRVSVTPRFFSPHLRRIFEDPEGRLTLSRSEIKPGIRSFHTVARKAARRWWNPVHVIFYRASKPSLLEILRVLHDRMEPSRHVTAS
jgi:toxin ParE1/3/4